MKSREITEKRRLLSKRYFVKGVMIAIVSGMSYGAYSAFITLAMGRGVWAEWYGENGGLSPFIVVYVLGTIGSGINDLVSAIWALGLAAGKGKLIDFFRCLVSKPGLVMIGCALVGGPISGAAYIIALQMSGSAIIPITALCPALGAIFSRFLFKQRLNARMILGILICFSATIMIGSVGISSPDPKTAAIGFLLAFVCALGWGIEGCVAGFGTTIIDYDIGITIRQVTSGLVNLGVFVPVMCLLSGKISFAPQLISDAFLSGSSMVIFAISGLFALYAYSLWYKGNSMCGTALGMACNGTYSFWGPFFCWLVLGVFMKEDGWNLPPIAWVGAFVMFVGVLVIAVNPLDIFGRKAVPSDEETVAVDEGRNSVAQKIKQAIPETLINLKTDEKRLPLNYAILKHFMNGEEADTKAVVTVLKQDYGKSRNFGEKYVAEALMTATANGILEETRYLAAEDGSLQIFYRVTESGRNMIARFI